MVKEENITFISIVIVILYRNYICRIRILKLQLATVECEKKRGNNSH